MTLASALADGEGSTTPPATQPPAAQPNSTDESRPNIGHYSVAGYEYFAEELTPVAQNALQANDGPARKRVFVLPRLTLLPDGVTVFDSAGREVPLNTIVTRLGGKPAAKAEPNAGEAATGPTKDGLCKCGSLSRANCPLHAEDSDRHSVMLRMAVTAGHIDRISKYLIASHYLNKRIDPSIVNLSTPDAGSLLPFSDNALEAASSDVLDKLDAVDGFTQRLRFEQVTPRSLVLTVSCGNRELVRKVFPASAYISSNSTLSVELTELPKALATRIANGHFCIEADMDVDLTRQQFARAGINLKKLNSFLAKEFADRETKVSQSSRGFLFWKKTQQAVETFVSRESRLQGTSESGESSYVDLRDADPALRDRAFTFLFDRQSGGANLLEEIIRNHLTAASNPGASDEERRAHQAYADYLRTLKTGDGDPAREKSAIDALADLVRLLTKESPEPGAQGDSGSSTGAAIATGAAAATGNPYVAFAMFMVNGLVWKESGTNDRFTASSLQQSSWSDEQSRSFTATIQNQRASGFTIVQSRFPQLRLWNSLLPEATTGSEPALSTEELHLKFREHVIKTLSGN
jgi:hypothetical protein